MARVIVSGLFAGMALGSILAGNITKGIAIALIAGLIANADRIRGAARPSAS